MIEAREAYLSRLRPAGSKRSKKRDLIVDVFLGQEGHLSAADLVDRMEAEGVIGPANHVGKREVLIPEPVEEI